MRRRAPTGHLRDSGPTCYTLARTTLALPDVSKAALSQSRMLRRSALQRSKESYETTELFVAMEQALEDIDSRLNNPGSVADVAKRGNREVEFRLPRARSREGFGGTPTVGAEGVHMTRFRGLERSRVVAPIYPTAPTYRFTSRVCNT